MRKTFKLVLAAILTVLISSCQENYRDVKVTSFDISEINVRGLRQITGIVELGVHNPASRFSLSEIAATLKTRNGESLLDVALSDFVLAERSDSVYQVKFDATLPQNISTRWLLANFQSLDPQTLLVDMGMKVKPSVGIGTTLSYKDVPFEKFKELK